MELWVWVFGVLFFSGFQALGLGVGVRVQGLGIYGVWTLVGLSASRVRGFEAVVDEP